MDWIAGGGRCIVHNTENQPGRCRSRRCYRHTGADLSNENRQKVLDELNVPDNATKVTVTNKEEHEYLGKYISNAQIGTRAISSSSITVAKKGSGLDVKTHNIDSITDEMYLNALMTAGVKDAKYT